MAGFKAPKPKKVTASGPGRTPFVLGSRPGDLRAQEPGSTRIKPLTGVTQYGKGQGGALQANPSGLSAGDTGQNEWS
jgi:hypothetical protein